MNEVFQRLCGQLVREEIDTSKFLTELRLIGGYGGDLLTAMREQYDRRDWKNLGRLMWAVSLVPDRSFTPLLCELLENHKYDAYREALADSLMEIADEKSVPCIIKALNYHVGGDDGRHFNRTLINALYKIGTEEAIDGIKQAHDSDNELIRSHSEESLSRLP
jgi:HEAT repeats